MCVFNLLACSLVFSIDFYSIRQTHLKPFIHLALRKKLIINGSFSISHSSAYSGPEIIWLFILLATLLNHLMAVLMVV